MKKIINIFVLSLAALVMASLSSCENKLDIDQHGVIGIDTYYKTDAEAQEAIANVYYLWNYMQFEFYVVLNFPSDDMYAGGKNFGANIPIEDMSFFTFDDSNSRMTNVFTYLYQIVYRCNVILDNITEPDTPAKKQAVAEAHFFRAWAYFYLTALWGTPPLADHVLTPDEYVLPNSTREELWALIEGDLTTAINSGALAEKSGANDVQVRITKTAAQSLLGKVYVWQEKWNDAATTLDAVINSGKYALFTGNYGDILQHTNEFNCESVLETNTIHDPANSLSVMTYVSIGWRGEQFDWSGNDTDLANSGFGQANPQRGLYDAFVAHEGADGYRLKNTLWTYEDVKSHGITIRPGQTIEQHDGIFSYKVRYTKDGQNSGPYNSHTNFRYMRYAEVLLLAAEAHVKNNNAGKATEYVNQIRTRAQLPSLSTVTMDDIKIEKRLELCYEHVRFMDLVRWGDAATALATKGQKIGVFTSDGVWNPEGYDNPRAGFKADKHELYPFPRTEMTVNTLIKQNQGYAVSE